MSQPPPNASILIVDPRPEVVAQLEGILAASYATSVATSADQGLGLATGGEPPALILVAAALPDTSGATFCGTLKAATTRAIPILLIADGDDPAVAEQGLAAGAADYLATPFLPALVLARVKTQLALRNQAAEVERLVEERTAELKKTRQLIIRRLGRAAENRDNETGNHIVRICQFAKLIGQAAGMGEEALETLCTAAPLHDVGKIGIPDHILLKPGKLDPAEWDVMRRHSTLGAEIIGDHDDHLLQVARDIALGHHEKWDGSGYPRGLAGEEIPLEARIIALADVFDALTSDRPYKKAWPIAEAVRRIEEQAGSHFDPGLIAPFKQVLPEMIAIREVFSDRHGPLPDRDLG